jgi:hypothetical protein
MVNFTNLDGIISKEVMDDEWQIIKTGIETQNATIIIEELFLASNTTTSKRLLHILLQTWITNNWLRDLLISEAVHWY